jgi:hypothetical protein
VFNERKTSEPEAKEIMRKVFKMNALKIWDARPGFFNILNNGTLLRENFQNFCDNISISNSLFNFVIATK